MKQYSVSSEAQSLKLSISSQALYHWMRGSRKFCEGGGGGVVLTLCFFSFLVDEGREDLNTTILSWSSSARQGNII